MSYQQRMAEVPDSVKMMEEAIQVQQNKNARKKKKKNKTKPTSTPPPINISVGAVAPAMSCGPVTAPITTPIVSTAPVSLQNAQYMVQMQLFGAIMNPNPFGGAGNPFANPFANPFVNPFANPFGNDVDNP